MSNSSASSIFKGIALFTPGGDLIYCIDPSKQGRWHLNLCAVLQEVLELPEPPHFLVPCYTATIDRWLDPRTQELITFAEAHPPVFRYRALLNAVFEVDDPTWTLVSPPEGLCDPAILATYRQRFPELWQSHDLVLHWTDKQAALVDLPDMVPALTPQKDLVSHDLPTPAAAETQGYVLRLFVSGYSAATKRILQSLHQLLEESLGYPYTLKVIDIFKNPEQAEADQISATPTLVKVHPQPVRRIVGNLEDVDRVLRMLGAPESRKEES